MDSMNERLQQARAAAGFDEASEAARALGIPEPTYMAHENGSRGFSRRAADYASFFRVSLQWLLTGRGKMKGAVDGVPLHGVVGAGAHILPTPDDGSNQPFDFVRLPSPDQLAALRVSGDSQYPRYLDGEIILFETIERTPSQLVGHYCVCDLEDGRRMVKLLRRGTEKGLFTLESVNASPIENVRLRTAFRVVGSISN